jgi:parvulin-like peptidyl-prolyl isomerase
VLFVARTPWAQEDASAREDARRAAVVARVGTETITVGELEERLARVPRYQLRMFGDTAPVIRKKFLDDILVRDALLVVAARDRHLDHDLAVEQTVDRTLAGGTIAHLRQSAGNPANVPMDQVQAYYDANRDKFVSPERIAVWRILCKTQDEAASVLAEAKKDGTPGTFTKLAREHSTDKATYLRGGNLGFLDPKGASDEPGVSVDPAVVAALASVKDGAFAPAPVPEAGGFAVAWRRGTKPGQSRTVDQAKRQIQDVIVTKMREGAEKELIERLRAQKVKDVDESLLGSFEISADDGHVFAHKRRGE